MKRKRRAEKELEKTTERGTLRTTKIKDRNDEGTIERAVKDLEDEAEENETIPIPPPPKPTFMFRNEAPSMNIESIHFPIDEKNWIHILPIDKQLNYPSFILKNNRELCYNSSDKSACNVNQHCNWISFQKHVYAYHKTGYARRIHQ